MGTRNLQAPAWRCADGQQWLSQRLLVCACCARAWEPAVGVEAGQGSGHLPLDKSRGPRMTS